MKCSSENGGSIVYGEPGATGNGGAARLRDVCSRAGECVDVEEGADTGVLAMIVA